MRQSLSILNSDEYRVVLIHDGSLLSLRDLSAPRLLRVKISRCIRQAEQLQRFIKETWRQKAIVLELLDAENNATKLAIVEVLTLDSSGSFITKDLDQVPEAELNAYEREKVEKTLFGFQENARPFARLGWIQDALGWLRSEVPENLSSLVDIHQFNASGCFALIRFDFENGAILWMKATGEPNRHEFHVTRSLAQICPQFLPPRIGEREDWNAWLMEDAGLSIDTWRPAAVELALRSMSTLQQTTLGRTDEFIALGAADQRIHILREHLAELIDGVDEAMKNQTSTKVSRIESSRLNQIEFTLREACLRLEDLDIPDTVIHNDINRGNVLFKETRCAFTDWSEIAVGNPFFTLHHLCRLQCNDCDRTSGAPREIYERCWAKYLTMNQIDRVLPLIPLLSILSYLYGRGAWFKSPRSTTSEAESYVRSMARHMDRAAQDPELLGALCH